MSSQDYVIRARLWDDIAWSNGTIQPLQGIRTQVVYLQLIFSRATLAKHVKAVVEGASNALGSHEMRPNGVDTTLEEEKTKDSI